MKSAFGIEHVSKSAMPSGLPSSTWHKAKRASRLTTEDVFGDKSLVRKPTGERLKRVSSGVSVRKK
jgi:hypothetical protein